MFSSLGAALSGDGDAWDVSALNHLDSSASGRSPVRSFPPKALRVHPCISVLLAGLASVAAVTMLISLCSASQRRLASKGLHTRQLSDEGNSSSNLTPQCVVYSRSSSMSVSPPQRKLPLKKRKLPVAEGTALGIGEEEWISGPSGSPTPVSSNSLLRELPPRPSEAPDLLHGMQRIADQNTRYPTPPPISRKTWLDAGCSGVDHVGIRMYPSFPCSSSSLSMLETIPGTPSGTPELPSLSATLLLPEGFPIPQTPIFRGVSEVGAGYGQYIQQTSLGSSGPSNSQSAFWTILGGSARRSTQSLSSPLEQVRHQHKKGPWSRWDQWTKEVLPRGGGYDLPCHNPAASGPSKRHPTSNALPTVHFGALAPGPFPFFHLLARQTTIHPRVAEAGPPEERSTETQMQERLDQIPRPHGVHSATSVVTPGDKIGRECKSNSGSEAENALEIKTSSTEEDKREAKPPGPIQSLQSLTSFSPDVSGWLPLEFRPTMALPLEDSESQVHLFFRQPVLYPPIVLRPFCAAAAFGFRPVPTDPVPLLEQSRRILRLSIITPEDLERLTAIAERLVSYAMVHQTKPLTNCTYLRALEGMGLRFMILDAVLCINSLIDFFGAVHLTVGELTRELHTACMEGRPEVVDLWSGRRTLVQKIVEL
ncbi:hypothetical protein, conserved [Eimeria acervulina]|uniref:Uncharacterized protein n=1 Tax=Eimeria acervulina TaxID=5801 RepID=U6GW23_EIMAC|nr:hypothetical protein, conserved [Eimeria acervulina]CDI84456.1 hypothetical protein, conserved [Eimeria acervulina]